MKERLESFISDLRIDAEPDLIINNEKLGFAEIMNRESKNTDVTFLGLKLPEEDGLNEYADTLLSKNGAEIQGSGISFQAQTICPDVVERHLIFAYMAAAPQNWFFERRTSYVPVRKPFRPEDGGGKGRGVLWV